MVMGSLINIKESVIESRISRAIQFSKGSHKDNNLWEFKSEADIWGVPNIKEINWRRRVEDINCEYCWDKERIN